ncbi:hypothetical protein [uncultured Chryseobacterium sp.]|jgi:hypothetical protein|uniref:hypothetical protein n=1 Tax=uncultured Chryseobacterium sp. TaxID=259322 RepID=UPI0026052438|nr:hypothetical protein [uncultured Chryseobacterium sp.]
MDVIIKKLFEQKWDFTLYQIDDKKIIEVVFHNSFVDTSKSFILNGEEQDYDFEQLKKLSENIRNNYESFKDREINPSINL